MKTSTPFWQQLILLGIGSINLVFLLIILSIWQTGDRLIGLITGLFQPEVNPQVSNSTLVVQRLQNLQELTTTVQKMEKIVPTSADRKLGELTIATTRLLYVAQGEIRAGVDLSQLSGRDIQIEGNRIAIDLPPAKIIDSKIDVRNSRVYDYNRGFLNLGPDIAPQLQTLAQRHTLSEIVDTACRQGILDTANSQAEQSIAELLNNLGYQQVEINTTISDSCGAISKV